MTGDTPERSSIELVDAALQDWRQGDCVLGEHWFAFGLSKNLPLTGAGLAAASNGAEIAEQQVRGFVVVTQTCDIVRTCESRPFIEVCPLVEVDSNKLGEIASFRRPAYAFLPLLADFSLVADLDRVMTFEKGVVASWKRVPGWGTDEEARAFAFALSRKRIRFAFPNDFSDWVSKLRNRVLDKHEKNSEEGLGLRALREIRVQASPSWEAAQCSILFLFIRNVKDEDSHKWSTLLGGWLNLVPSSGRFVHVEGQVTTLEDITAAEYLSSDLLDLDHLSRGSGG